MTAVFDPYRAQRRLHWRNRVGAWRAQWAQTVLHALALLALTILLGAPAWRALADFAPIATAAMQRWPLSLALAAWVLLALRHAGRIAVLRQCHARDWLAALPVARAIRQRNVRDAVLLDAVLHAVAGIAVLSALRAPAIALAIYGAIVAASAALSPWLAGRSATANAGLREPPISRLRDAGSGRLWRWQRSEAGVALRGRILALGGFAWLLVPMGSGPFLVLCVGIAGLLVALLAGGWTRSVAVLPRAQAWLAAQPLRAAWLLRDTAAVPLLILALSVLLAGVATATLGVPAAMLFVIVAIVAFGSLHFAVVAAERRRPRRIGFVFVLQVVLLLAVLQVFAPLALACWGGQMIFLWRRALR